MAEVTKLLYLILIIPAKSSSLKCVNYYMRCSQSEEGLSNLVFIFMNKNLLKKMKVKFTVDTFHSRMIDEFEKKKQRIELILQINFNNSLFIDFIIFSRDQ